MKAMSILFIGFLIQMIACNQAETNQSTYKVSKISMQPEINAVWDKKPWSEIQPLQIKNYMGDKPEHFPFTQAKVAYDEFAIYVIFRVEDRYVKALTKKNHGPVYTDSCVEFFFTPGSKVEKGYFNLEMNCGGTMLFHHQMEPRTGSIKISETHIQQVEVATTLPKIVDPEIDKDTTWIAEYRIPFSILTEYHDFPGPEAGSVWRANFYKCADQTSHPHWLTWAPIDYPTPNFHIPQYFGNLEFQK